MKHVNINSDFRSENRKGKYRYTQMKGWAQANKAELTCRKVEKYDFLVANP